MRVLILTHSYQGNGAARCLLGLMQHWTQARDWQIDALHDGNPADALEIREAGATPVFAAEVNAKLDQYRFALVNTLVTVEPFLPVMQRLPTVLWVHEGRVLMSNTSVPPPVWSQIFSLPRLLVFQSPWQIDRMFASYLADVPKERTALVYNGLRPEAAAQSTNWQTQRATRKQARAAGSRAQVMCCGSVIPRKRPNDLLAAMSALPQLHAQAHFIGTLAHMNLFADAGFRAEHQQYASAPHPETARYRFHGELRFEATQSLLAQGDVLVSCSSDESQGMASLEAACHGLPLVLSDLECYEGIWRHGYNALLFPVGHRRLLAHQLAALVNDLDLCQELGQAARQVSERFAHSRFTRAFDDAVAQAGLA